MNYYDPYESGDFLTEDINKLLSKYYEGILDIVYSSEGLFDISRDFITGDRDRNYIILTPKRDLNSYLSEILRLKDFSLVVDERIEKLNSNNLQCFFGEGKIISENYYIDKDGIGVAGKYINHHSRG